MTASKKDKYRLDEERYVQKPFLAQLDGLSWKTKTLPRTQKASDTERADFVELVMMDTLKESIQRINDWMEPDQVDEVTQRLTSFTSSDLIQNNKLVLRQLLEGTSVAENRKTGAKSPTVRYIDFTPEGINNNSFIAIAEMKFRIPGTDKHFYPDIVLFVNGLPLAIVECKSPKEKEAIAKGIDQLMRYSEQRGEKDEGNRRLFYFNQILVSTCRNQAKYGTITTRIEKHFYRWADPYPLTLDGLEHGATSPSDQHRLVAGMFAKPNLLSLIRTFTVFTTSDNGQTIKMVARYQQFRAVKVTVQRLLGKPTPLERSGIIWHTQGSGKSMTMMFMVREMYQHPDLCEWKVVFVTDRTQLEGQLEEVAPSTGFKVNVANSSAELKDLLRNKTSDLNMAMIHKFREHEMREIYPKLNDSAKILVMTDEAHRSQYKTLAANLDRAIPNATHIAYTGTPTDKTEKRYRDYIDRYTMRQSIEDGVTLKIVYTLRTQKAEVTDKAAMDTMFADIFSDYNIMERLQILGYGSKEAYMDAEDIIRDKAEDMVRHWVNEVYPNGFKAQVVANSRMAAARYKEAIENALQKVINELEADNPLNLNLDQLKTIKAGVVISGSHNDEPLIKQYTDTREHDRIRKSFKLPIDGQDEDITGAIGFVVVQNMWLTGFDAPIEQVLYLDRIITAHNLLQAIARVNRVAGKDKEEGFVVDYVGVGHHLKDALDIYDEKEQKDLLENIDTSVDDLNELVESHKEMKGFVEQKGIQDLSDYDAFYDLFYDEEICFEFMEKFKRFSKALSDVFPRKEALDYMNDMYQFADLSVEAEKHFNDQRISMVGIPRKLRRITDQYLESQGVTEKVAPISIFDKDFEKQVEKRTRKKTKAAAVEHAIRHHIDIHLDDDPELYASFAEALEHILEEFADNWERIYIELEKLRKKMREAQNEPTYGLHRRKQMPFFRVFKREIYGEVAPSDDEIAELVDLTQNVYNTIETELGMKGFWDSPPARKKLEAQILDIFNSPQFYKIGELRNRRKEIISRLMELAEKNNDTILYSD